jgi:flagellar FliJ protein
MAAFRFRLATLLKLRRAVRDQARTHLAQAQQAQALLNERLSALQSELAAARHVQQLRPGAVDVDRLLAASRYEAVLRYQEQELLAQRDLVAAEVERRRELLLAADRDLKALEKLEQRQAHQHRAQTERRALADLDEAAGNVFREDRR